MAYSLGVRYGAVPETADSTRKRIDRPLRLGEVLAETVRLYGERKGAALGLGAGFAALFLLSAVVHPLGGVLIVAAAFTAGYAAAARLVAGDGIGRALAETGRRAPTLLPLTLLVTLPFALSLSFLILLILAAAWLALTGFAIPAAVLEPEREAGGWLERVRHAVGRSFALARTEYLHAFGVVAALVVVYLVLGIPLGVALAQLAGLQQGLALALVQLVLGPFFFLGLSVLYFDQTARAVSS